MAWLSLEELKKYDAKKELKKMGQAEKSATSLRSGGQPVEVVRDTGLMSSIRDYRKQQAKKVKTPVKGTIGRKYDTEKGFTVQGLTVKPERSNAKSEKTRLYQTYDNLLDEKEIRKKYSYVAQDKERVMSMLDMLMMKWISKEGKDMFNLQANAYDIGKGIASDLDMEMVKIGIAITSFTIQSVSYPEEVAKMQQKAAAQSMIGNVNTYTQMQMADALTQPNTAAGSMAGNMAGMQMGMAMGQMMGQMMNGNMQNNAQQNQAAPSSNGTVPKFCPNCGTPTNGARFCSNCGTKLA